ncbi:MAG: glutaredoxin family protein [Selenomonas sp.]|uniref:glutaredoxin family protein n=1 Tax=Selenomonas sp. TaxID=2053611 RepID=UPI0025ED102A|nr:glutaredoxin family protein [Selenomonas sp.]MCR5757476.1 glutaredoxin family protein [Selenomonas sp.]
MVKVYSIHNCPWCDKVKKYLKSRNVDYQECNIEDDAAALAECQALTNDEAVPVVTVDGKEYVLGFDKGKIDAMLGLN